MATLLALDPSLGLSARQFAAAWNADSRTDDLATADLRTAGLAEAGPPDVKEHVVLETAAAAMALSAAALSDLIRDILRQEGAPGAVQFAEETTASGDVLVHVTPAAEQ